MDDDEFTFTNTADDGDSEPEPADDGGVDSLDYSYELADNVVEDLVKYTRSKTVRNEQQFVLTTLGYISGFMQNPKHYVAGVLIGTAGSGKSHLQNTVVELLDDSYVYNVTTGSEKAIIYDRENWNASRVANMDELQKPSEDIIEILKSLHGGEDEEFVYKVTGGGEGADRETDGITLDAMPYWFLYAQYEPDFEMWDRLLKVPVHESKQKNRGVIRTQWDHSFISFSEDDGVEYMYDFDEGKQALRDHINSLPRDAWVKIPAGEEEFGGVNFVKYAEPIFDEDRSEVNRVSSMVANLVRASALLNHENREKRRINVRNKGTKEAIIAEPQDLANVLACRDVLLATTHQLDRKRRAVCLAIEQAGGPRNAAPISSSPKSDKDSIMSYLRKTNASFVKRNQIEAILDDLQENYMVEKLENAGENGRHLYQFTSWQNLGKFEINDDFKEMFADVDDPFSDRNFVETARQSNEELTPSASDFMSDASVSSDSQQTGGQATLTGESDEEVDVDLDPHEKAVHERLSANLDGRTITGLDEHEPSIREMIGVVEIGEMDDSTDIEGTILDPAHEVWYHGPDEWVQSVDEAEKEIEQAVRKLTVEGIFQTSTTETKNGQPVEMEVSVKDV